MYPLRSNQDPAPRLHSCFLAALPLSLHPFPSGISNSLNLPFGTQGRSWRLESRNGTDRLPCLGAHRVLLRFRTDQVIRGLELSVPLPWFGKERVLEVELMANGQWFNQLYLCNEASTKTQKDRIWRASSWCTSGDLGRVVPLGRA